MRCKICNYADVISIAANEKYYYCPYCDLIFIDEGDIISPKEEIKRYEEHNNTPENSGYVQMFENFIHEVINPYKEGIETVLDFGCGPGPVLAKLLEERGMKVDVYDPYFFPEKVYEGKKYDLITSTEVFEHFKKPADGLKLIVSHLNDDGYLAVMTRFHPGREEFPEWWYKRDPTHVTFYTSKTFEEIARRFSLKIIFIDGEKYCLFQKR